MFFFNSDKALVAGFLIQFAGLSLTINNYSSLSLPVPHVLVLHNLVQFMSRLESLFILNLSVCVEFVHLILLNN